MRLRLRPRHLLGTLVLLELVWLFGANVFLNTDLASMKKLGLKPYKAHGNYMLVDATMTGKSTAEILEAAIDMEKIYLKRINLVIKKFILKTLFILLLKSSYYFSTTF